MAYLDRHGDADVGRPARRAWPRAAAAAGHLRLGAAVPALHRAVPQGRTADGRLPADHRRGRARPRRSPAGPTPSAGCRWHRRSATCGALVEQRGRPVLRLHLRDRARLAAAARGERGHGVTGVSPPRSGPARQPAARPARPAAAAGSRPVRARRVRRHRRPGAQEAASPPSTTSPTAACCRPGFALLGFARRDWGDGDFARPGAQGGARRARAPASARTSGTGSPTASGSCPARSTTTTRSTPSPQTLVDLEESHGIQGNAAFYLSIPPAMFPVVLKQMQRTGMADNDDARRLATRRRREAVRARPAERAASSTSSSTRLHRRRTCSASTTTSARRRCRTCWRCASPTRCSSRCGTATSSTRCRSPWPRTSASARRAGFYDTAGAARDVLQNHVLQLLALTAMEEPVSFDAESIRTEKTKVLGAISLPTDLASLRRARAVRPGLARRRARRRATSTSRTSRRLDDRDLRRGPARRRDPALGRRPVLPAHRQAAPPAGHRDRGDLQEGAAPAVRRRPTPRSSGTTSSSIRVQPDEGITLRFGSKVPGSAMEVRDVSMDFLYGEAFTESSPEAYERLLLDVLIGDATLFPRNEEVELSWRGHRPARGVLGGHASRSSTAPVSGVRKAPTRCSPATAGPGGDLR